MKCCLKSFKNRLDHEAAMEMNAFKISYDAACVLIHNKEREISDLKDKLNRLDARLVKRNTLVKDLRFQINNPGWDEQAYIDNIDGLEEEIKLLEAKAELEQSLIEHQAKEIDTLLKERQDLTKKVQQFQESATKAKKQKQNQFRVLFPSLKMDD